MQCIEVNKNEKIRTTSNPDVDPMMRSRLVVRGVLENNFGRKDSPTADNEGAAFVCSFAASRRLRLRSGDLEAGYFQGEEMSRVLILKPPPSGLPDGAVGPTDRLLARVPIYGTKDAGRGLWRKVRKCFLGKGLKEVFGQQGLYVLVIDQTPEMLVATHVDDLLFAFSDKCEKVWEHIQKELEFGKINKDRFDGVAASITRTRKPSISR